MRAILSRSGARNAPLAPRTRCHRYWPRSARAQDCSHRLSAQERHCLRSARGRPREKPREPPGYAALLGELSTPPARRWSGSFAWNRAHSIATGSERRVQCGKAEEREAERRCGANSCVLGSTRDRLFRQRADRYRISDLCANGVMSSQRNLIRSYRPFNGRLGSLLRHALAVDVFPSSTPGLWRCWMPSHVPQHVTTKLTTCLSLASCSCTPPSAEEAKIRRQRRLGPSRNFDDAYPGEAVVFLQVVAEDLHPRPQLADHVLVRLEGAALVAQVLAILLLVLLVRVRIDLQRAVELRVEAQPLVQVGHGLPRSSHKVFESMYRSESIVSKRATSCYQLAAAPW
eukprot:scaffold53_cov193-Pinguiococcus_pyrenoidosus.AAC.23